MAVFSPQQIAPALIDFVTERHLAILTLVRPDGRPHSTPIGFMWDDESKEVKNYYLVWEFKNPTS